MLEMQQEVQMNIFWDSLRVVCLVIFEHYD